VLAISRVATVEAGPHAEDECGEVGPSGTEQASDEAIGYDDFDLKGAEAGEGIGHVVYECCSWSRTQQTKQIWIEKELKS
jgi:hypothetical protein